MKSTYAQPGQRVLRGEDHALLRGDAAFVGDLPADALHLVLVRSACANARMLAIDTVAAAGVLGVVAVVTADDPSVPPRAPLPGMVAGIERPLLARDHVRYVGEPLVAIVAGSAAAARDAAELVVVEYEPLAVAAAVGDRATVHDGLAANVYLTGQHRSGADPLDAEVIVRGEYVTQRVAPAPMEPNGVLAIPSEDGSVTLWASSQFVHGAQREVAKLLGLDTGSVRVLIPRVGGGFGAKFETAAEYVLAAYLARRFGRPVRWHEDRSENLLVMPHGRGHHQRAALGLSREGVIHGLHARVVADAGAYPMAGAGSPVGTGVLISPGPYRVANLDIEVQTTATNTAPVGVYRGPGRAEPNYLRERLIDAAARQLAIDPVELRRRNLLRADELPYTTPTGFVYDECDYHACLAAAVAAVDYGTVRAEQAARRARGDTVELGVGVACWLDVTPRNRAGEYAAIELHALGGDELRADVRAGTCDHGQGHEVTWALVLSGLLGIPLEAVRLIPADTATVPRGDGTGSARSLQVVSNALTHAGNSLLVQARAVAAHLLEASPADLVVVPGGLAVAGTPSRHVTWPTMARAAADPTHLPADVAALVPEGLRAEADVDQDGATFPFGVHAAVVEVDTETGKVELLRFVAVDDCGRVVNPVVVEGQQHGGIAQGVGQALYEAVLFDEAGQPLTTNFTTYLVPSAAELPSFEVSTLETPTPRNALGAKGIGQGGAIGAPAAVVNAAIDALSGRGVRHLDMPLSPQRVFQALADAAR